jgi:putative endonuclease
VVFPPKADPPPADIPTNIGIAMYYLYVLKSLTKDWHYIGSTDNTEKRLKEHNSGKTKSTKAYRPFIIAYTESFHSKTLARKREIFLKKNFKAREQIFRSL